MFLYNKLYNSRPIHSFWAVSTCVLLRQVFSRSNNVLLPLKSNKLNYLFARVPSIVFNTCSLRRSIILSKCFSTKMSDSEDKKTELKKRLTPVQYHVTQEKGTERAFTGKYNKCSEAGTYSCIVCDQPLFSSQTKFDAGCGWPAFNDVLEQGKVKLTKDTSHVGANLLLLIANPGMIRTEVTCAQCNAHLGHVFGDGPPPTKKRFCINSASLQFHQADEQAN